MFVVFDRTEKRTLSNLEEFISVGPYGKFAFSVAATEFMKSKGFTEKIVLLFDKEKKVIGLRKPLDISEHQYKLTFHHKRYLVFSSPSFVNYIDYPANKTMRFGLKWDNKNEMYTADLSDIYKSEYGSL